MSARCGAKVKSGERCVNRAWTGAFCHAHRGGKREQCAALTFPYRGGARLCRNRVLYVGAKHCGVHDSERIAARAALEDGPTHFDRGSAERKELQAAARSLFLNLSGGLSSTRTARLRKALEPFR